MHSACFSCNLQLSVSTLVDQPEQIKSRWNEQEGMTQASTDSAPKPAGPELQSELAAIRTLLALDRTLLAWVRTSVSLIGFGFALARFVHHFVDQGFLKGVQPDNARHLGICIMVLGIIGLLGGTYEYLRSMKTLKKAFTMPTVSASLIITLVLLCVAFILIFDLLANVH